MLLALPPEIFPDKVAVRPLVNVISLVIPEVDDNVMALASSRLATSRKRMSAVLTVFAKVTVPDPSAPVAPMDSAPEVLEPVACAIPALTVTAVKLFAVLNVRAPVPDLVRVPPMAPPLKVQLPLPEIVVEVGATPPALTATVSPVAALKVTSSPVWKTVTRSPQLVAVESQTFEGPAVFQVSVAAGAEATAKAAAAIIKPFAGLRDTMNKFFAQSPNRARKSPLLCATNTP